MIFGWVMTVGDGEEGAISGRYGSAVANSDMLMKWARRAQRGARIAYFVPTGAKPHMQKDCPRAVYNLVRWMRAKGLADLHYIGRASGGPAYIVQRSGRPWAPVFDQPVKTFDTEQPSERWRERVL